MEERQATVDGKTYILPIPFFVIATENPIEMAGSYPLVEAQLDRFLMKISLGYPSRNELKKIANLYLWKNNSDFNYNFKTKLSKEDIILAFDEVRNVYIDEKIHDYCCDIFEYIHQDSKVYLPPSPRSLLHILRTSASLAYLKGRDYVIPDDVKQVSPSVLSHRIILKSSSNFKDNVLYINEVLKKVEVPYM
jgi:MoxR-like ATPase